MKQSINNFKELGDLLPNPDKDKKVIVFIDAEYVIQSLRNLKGKPKNNTVPIANIYWKEIVGFVLKRRTLQEVIYYSSELNKDENEKTYQQQQAYIKNIEQTVDKISVRLSKMQKVKVKTEKTWDENSANKKTEYLTTWVQKGVDVKIVTDILIKASKNEYDIAVLIAGDSDFEEAIKSVRSQFNKKVELVSFDRYDSGLVPALVQSVNEHITIRYEDGKNILWKEIIKK